jgi:hypothetical protein
MERCHFLHDLGAVYRIGGFYGGTERLLGYNLGHVSILNARSRLPAAPLPARGASRSPSTRKVRKNGSATVGLRECNVRAESAWSRLTLGNFGPP